MSRVGKLPINLPTGIKVSVDGANVVTVKGPKGELSQALDRDISLEVEDGLLTVKRPTDQKRHKALHGLYRALINNMVLGVSTGFEKRMELVGVGFRASNFNPQVLEIAVGYSHPIYFVVPKEVTALTENVKGKNPVIVLQSADKQLLGQVAAKIRGLRAPEPYKGKGIRFEGEAIRRKQGKSAGKGKK